MKPELIEAIEGSVRKWDCICQGISYDGLADNCPLCEMFSYEHCADKLGNICPIANNTGNQGCDDTPWEEFNNICNIAGLTLWVDDEERNIPNLIMNLGGVLSDKVVCDIAEEEVEYLISLLPENHEWRQEL